MSPPRTCEQTTPVRPALPAALFCCAGAWAAVAVVVSLGLSGEGAVAGAAGLSCAVCLGLFLLAAIGALVASQRACRQLRRAAVALLLLAVSWGMGSASAGLHYTRQDELAAQAVELGASAFRFVVESDPRASSYGGCSFRATAYGEPGSLDCWVSLNTGDDVDSPQLGEVLLLRGSMTRFDLADDYDRSRYLQGCGVQVKAVRMDNLGFADGAVAAVRAFRASALSALAAGSDPADSLIAGLVFGNQAATSQSGISDTFSKLGLSHMIAVSGSHLALVAAMLGVALSAFLLRPRGRAVLLAALLAVYVCLTGFQISAVRAFAMTLIALVGRVVARRAHGPTSLSLAALTILLCVPSSAFSLGFQLSVASVLGLVLFGGLAQSWLEEALPVPVPETLASTLSVTLLAQAVTLPLTLPVFGTLPVLSPLANVVLVPVMSLVLLLGLLWCVLALVLPQVSGLVLAPCRLLAQAVCAASSWAQGLGAIAPVVDVGGFPLWAAMLVGMGLAYAFWPKASKRVAWFLGGAALLAALALVLVSAAFPPERMVVLDVGQGDAILLQGGGASILVDTGPDDSVVWALARQGVHRLDAVVLTHTDLDHVGGLSYLAGHVGVGRVVYAGGVGEALAAEDTHSLVATIGESLRCETAEVLAGDTMSAGSLTLCVLWPASSVRGDENADSIVMHAFWGDAASPRLSALLTGDAELDVLEPLACQGALPRVDILKIAHHGSAASTSRELVQSLGCTVAVASAGAGNRYGHPRQECVDAVQQAGARFLCTVDAGDVAFSGQEDGLRVSSARDVPLAA